MIREPSSHPEIDRLLERALAAWQSLPDVEREINEWDLVDQLVFVEEWPIEEDRLLALSGHAARGELTDKQRARYDALLRIVERHRPIVERLRAG
jgi:hypothetical protein